ncbi:MAG: hypothetical protein HOQ09_01425, partial [Gemmatimonadaceae bacterium]|nr:hypothetical protein [Gemmatimonadaceae bacterium]
LYAIHQGRVADALAHGARIVPLTVADPVAYQQREEQSSISNALSCGYWSRRGEQLVLTWKGAFLSAWRLLPPWKQLVARRDERLAARFARA